MIFRLNPTDERVWRQVEEKKNWEEQTQPGGEFLVAAAKQKAHR